MGNFTYKVRHQTTIGKPSGGEPEVSFAVRPEASLVKSCGVDVIIVASIQKRVPKDEESSMIFRQRMGFKTSLTKQYVELKFINNTTNWPWQVLGISINAFSP